MSGWRLSSHSCRCDIIVLGGVGFSFLGGICLGVKREAVRAEVLGPIILPCVVASEKPEAREAGGVAAVAATQPTS